MSNQPLSICAFCNTPSPTCPWKYNFTPVKGWTATKTKYRTAAKELVDSYIVTECPLYTENTRNTKNSEPKTKQDKTRFFIDSTCACCGTIVPEGRHVCNTCLKNAGFRFEES